MRVGLHLGLALDLVRIVHQPAPDTDCLECSARS